MGYVLGIDQGGTKTFAAIMDYDGNILAHGKGEGCYYPFSGIPKAMECISNAVFEALDAAKLQIDNIDQIIAGITGIDWEQDSSKISAVLQDRFRVSNVSSYNDCVIALYSGTHNPYGATICAGTGLNCAIFTPDGRSFVLGDYLKDTLQGGSALAHRAIQAVFDSELGVLPPTGLTKLFLNFAGCTTVDDLLYKFITNSEFQKTMPRAAHFVIELANDGDNVTQNLLRNFTDELCECFVAALKKMDMLKSSYDIVLAGSIFKGADNKLTEWVIENLTHAIPSATIVNAKYEPVVGACVMGMLKKHTSFTTNQLKNLSDTAAKLQLIRTIRE